MTSFGLENRVSVVTGTLIHGISHFLIGSARGIGEAIVRTLAKNGASILLADVLEKEVKKVTDDLVKGLLQLTVLSTFNFRVSKSKVCLHCSRFDQTVGGQQTWRLLQTTF